MSELGLDVLPSLKEVVLKDIVDKIFTTYAQHS